MTIETSVPQARAHIGAILPTLGDEEVLIADALLTRIAGGQRQYGRFSLASDGRDFTREAGEEGADACIYHGAALVRAALRGVAKPRSVLPDVPVCPTPQEAEVLYGKGSFAAEAVRLAHEIDKGFREIAEVLAPKPAHDPASLAEALRVAREYKAMMAEVLAPKPAPPAKPREWWVVKSLLPTPEYLRDAGPGKWWGLRHKAKQFATRDAAWDAMLLYATPEERKYFKYRIVHVTARPKAPR